MKSLFLFGVIGMVLPGHGAETDQFFAWGVTLEDSADPLNAYLNEEAEAFLASRNNWNRQIHTAEELGQDFYVWLFAGLHSSKVRDFLWQSEDVDRYPKKADMTPRDYQRASIYRKPAFPFWLPMARTINVNGVYCGIDKIGHFFGFGRRYYAQYLDIIAEGAPVEEAQRRIVEVGIKTESSLVGGFVDGIFSHGDLEANYQGFRMLRDLTQAPAPYFYEEDGEWKLAGEIDIRPYVTPDFDESYNVNHYRGMRKSQVIGILQEEYCQRRNDPEVIARFERYAEHPRSFSYDTIHAYFSEDDENAMDEQRLETICDAAVTASE
jgi:hypothetical protein